MESADAWLLCARASVQPAHKRFSACRLLLNRTPLCLVFRCYLTLVRRAPIGVGQVSGRVAAARSRQRGAGWQNSCNSISGNPAN